MTARLPRRPIGVAFIIESLGSGGAERQLVELACRLDQTRFAPRVLTFLDDNFFASRLERYGVPHCRVRRKGHWDLRPAAIPAWWLRRGHVEIVHGFLYTGNLYAAAARILAGRGKVIATERGSVCDETLAGASRHYVPWSFRRADLVVANSRAARENLVERFGLSPEHTLYLPNAIESSRFKPADEQQRVAVRERLGWREDELVILIVSSFKEQKNPLGVVRALSKAARAGVRFRACWAGAPQPLAAFEETKALAGQLGLGPERMDFLGQRSDVDDLYRACDVVLLYSSWEGTANVIHEAQATGRPVVATEVADASDYVIPGETGWLVVPKDDDGLAKVLAEVADTDRSVLKRMGEEGFRRLLALDRGPDGVARRVEEVYARLLELPPAGQSMDRGE